MLKGHVFSKQIFGNSIFALFINTFLNGTNGISANYKNGMALSHSGSDITIESGAICIQGRFIEEDTRYTISAGTETMYCKLVIEVNLDKTNTENDFEQAYYKIVKSGTGYPNLTQNNIVKNEAGIYQYELARFRTGANGISDFQDKRTFLSFQSIYDEIRRHIQAIDDESLWLLKAGGTLTGPVTMQRNSLDGFMHSRTINDVQYISKVGAGQYEDSGETSLVLTDNTGKILGRLDIRADGKIYNGKSNSKLIELEEFNNHVRQNNQQFAQIDTQISKLASDLDDYKSQSENDLNNHTRQNDTQFSQIDERLTALEEQILGHISQNDTQFAQIDTRLRNLENRA